MKGQTLEPKSEYETSEICKNYPIYFTFCLELLIKTVFDSHFTKPRASEILMDQGETNEGSDAGYWIPDTGYTTAGRSLIFFARLDDASAEST